MKYRSVVLGLVGLIVPSALYVYPVLFKGRKVRKMQVLPAQQLPAFLAQYEKLIQSVERDLPVASHNNALDIFKRWGAYKIAQHDLQDKLSSIYGMIDDDHLVDGYYAIKDVLDVMKVPVGINSWWDVSDARALEL